MEKLAVERLKKLVKNIIAGEKKIENGIFDFKHWKLIKRVFPHLLSEKGGLKYKFFANLN